jgi:Golgi phosphoprotein 3 (GPP34)
VKTGWASDFFLVANDEFTGKLLVNKNLLACGLAASQLAELVATEQVTLDDGLVVVIDDDGPRSGVGAFVMSTIAEQTTNHGVRSWIQNLGEVLCELVARQLVEDGVLRRERTGVRRSERYPAVDLLRAARPRIWVESAIADPRKMELATAWLVALICVLQVEQRVLGPTTDRAAARELGEAIVPKLPGHLQTVLEGCRATGESVALTIKR